MPKTHTFTARMRVTYEETWEVEAADEKEARRKIESLTDDVVTDETGEVVDWEISNINMARVA